MNRDKHISRMKNIRILQAIGLSPRYIDGGNNDCSFPSDLKEKIPFSSHYHTYNEYIQDIDSVRRTVASDGVVSEDVLKRILETNQELNIT